MWGNPKHMASLAKSLRQRHSADEVYILCAKSNPGFFTYDGIELCSERVGAQVRLDGRVGSDVAEDGVIHLPALL